MGRAQHRGKFLERLPNRLALLGLLVVLLTGANFLWQRNQEATTPGAPLQAGAATDRLINGLQARLRALPEDREAYVHLGTAYLQKARETGDLSYYYRAEEAALQALAREPGDISAMVLISALALGRHQFQEALEWAQRSLELDPSNANAYGILGDAQVELGQYDEAIESYQAMVDLKPNLNSYARVARSRELMGDNAGAIEAMKMAVAAGPPRAEATAWARVQLGDLYFNSGRIAEATAHYEAALSDFKDYYMALAALGKARAAQGRYDEAIDLYGRALEVIPQPATLAALGDLYAKVGQTDQAQLQYDTVEFIARLAAINQQVYNRELALFYADHDLKLEEALGLAARELEVRKDIYGYDVLAWALYKNRRLEEAATAITEAMKLGTQDANLYYHAGMVYHRLGDPERARDYLERALSLNPHFSVLHEDSARQTLAELPGQVDSPARNGAAAP